MDPYANITTTNITTNYTYGKLVDDEAIGPTLAPTSIPTITTTTMIPNNNKTNPDASSSVQVLVIFLVAVFGILVLFLFVYFYLVKGSRTESGQERALQKSTSGSITDDGARNIFAHPEKQMAVDQSTRASPSPAEPAAAAKRNSTSPAMADSNLDRNAAHKSSGFQVQQKPKSSSQQQLNSKSKQSLPPKVEGHQQLASKSSSGGAKRGANSSVAGTLATLRETLKDHTTK